MPWKYADKYNAPVILRPSDTDQEILDLIKAEQERLGLPSNNTALIREALKAWYKLFNISDYSLTPTPGRKP